MRDNNLFVVPLDSGEIVAAHRRAAEKRDPRETDSQKFVKAEEQKLIEHTRVEAEKKKKAEEKDKARALPKFELADRQSATDLQLSPDGTHVFILIVERTETAKRPNVPNYVTESSYTEDIPARTFVGDAQDKRTLAMMNLETGKTVASGCRLRRHGSLKPAQGRQGRKPRAVRWGMPQMSDDGALAVAHVRADDNKDRWLVVVDPESGKIARARHAARRRVGARGRRLRTERSVVWLAAGSEARLVSLGARRLDASLHASTPPPTVRPRVS